MKFVAATSSLIAGLLLAGCATPRAASPQRPVIATSLSTSTSTSTSITSAEVVAQLRESIPPPFFPNPKAAPFQFPAETPQTHGIDLTVHDRATAERYFQWLCDNDAGTWVRRVVDGVEGVLAMRHRPYYLGSSYREVRDRFYLEDPWGETVNGGIMRTDAGADDIRSYVPESEWILPGKQSIWYGPKGFHVYFPMLGYEYFERPVIERELRTGKFSRFVRFERVIPPGSAITSDLRDIQEFGVGNGRARSENRFRQPGEVWLWTPLIYQEALREPRPKAIDAPSSRYGFFWRGIQRSPQDRYLNIGGGEEYVVDLSNNNIVAYRRGFVLADGVPGAGQPIDWSRRRACAVTKFQWIQTVLRPADGLVRRGIDLKTHPTPEEIPGEVGRLNR